MNIRLATARDMAICRATTKRMTYYVVQLITGTYSVKRHPGLGDNILYQVRSDGACIAWQPEPAVPSLLRAQAI